MSGVVIGLDIGGTKLAGGVLTRQARLLERRERPSRAADGVDVSLAQVWEILEELRQAAAPHGSLDGIGIAAPGPLLPASGVILNPTNMPGWVNVPLAEETRRRFGVPCRVENDANAAGLAEARFGAGRGCRSVFYVTLSTGIGSGIILDGRVYHGKNGFAGEGGHVTIDWRSPTRCNCGSFGCIEALASGSSLARRARPAEDIAAAAAAGEVWAQELIAQTAEMLGAWLGSVVSLLDPDIIVIGGGVSRIGEPLFAGLRAVLPARTINPFASQTPIVPAALDRDAGIYGAAAVILSA